MESLKNKLTEEEARCLLGKIFKSNITLSINGYYKLDRLAIIETWKQKGYIKQNPAEKAREIINIFGNIREDEDYTVNGEDLEDIIIGFNYLKKQLEEIKVTK